MAAPAALAPAQRVGITAGVLLALGYGEATLGPVALGSLRDASGSYEVGWLLALLVVLQIPYRLFALWTGNYAPLGPSAPRRFGTLPIALLDIQLVDAGACAEDELR